MKLLRNHRLLLTSAIALLLFVFTGTAIASNMGFKLNYGIISSINRLLSGSGLSISTEPPMQPHKYNDPGDYGGIILNIGQPGPQNSNMGFKLNLQSIPENGILVEDSYGNLYRLVEKANAEGEHYIHLEEVS